VISASPQDYETLKRIITELDVPRVQILVEAIIVEISVERTRSLGIDLTSSTGISNSILGFGQVNTSQFQNALGNPLGIQGLALALTSSALCTVPTAAANVTTGTGGTTVSGTTTGTTANVPCSMALLQALETDTHANVLSAPTLLTADNEEATIVVGQNVPFVGSASANSGLPGQIFNSVQRQNVGITLDIVPQSSEGGYIRLDMYEEVSNVLGNTANNPLGPTTTIRDASTTVFVQNHRTAVVGGLISGNENYNATGIPWISDIPVVGNLLSTKGTDRTKDNLLVFLTPHIVHDKADLRALALDQRQQFINSIGPSELHRMPASQVRELYKPSFSVAVPPAADLTGPAAAAAGTPPSASPEPPEGSTRSPGATPFNTEEIGPSSSVNLPPGTPMVATETGAPASFEAPPGTPRRLIPLRTGSTPDTGTSVPSGSPISSSVVPAAPSASGAVAAAGATD
ncbi:MAG TPA: hypothetical protein VEF03_04235, partial [Candidatus Binataceae bacterium]|nr:hypothetical protein [Candidatus Binataceae bacterium]